MLTIDHIVLSSTDLARDAAALEERLGVPLSEGGKQRFLEPITNCCVWGIFIWN